MPFPLGRHYESVVLGYLVITRGVGPYLDPKDYLSSED